MAVLTIVDVTGVQKYIFATNNLRENVGASELVAQATNEWIKEILNSEKGQEIYCGGGNALLLFDCLKKAKEFAKKYTKKILREAPNLEVVLTHSSTFGFEETDENYESLQTVTEKTLQKLNQKKASRRISAPLLGLAVSVQCTSTGGTATDLHSKTKQHMSSESLAKLNKAEHANKRLAEEIFKNLNLKNLEIPLDFDYLGRTKDEASYIAVVHIDGNGMGARVKKVGEQKNNKKWVQEVGGFSKSIEAQSLSALQKTMEFLLKNLNDDSNESIELINSEEDPSKRYLPFRPLISGGDDLTFVCDARIALDLTVFYLRQLQKNNLTDGEPIYARAGIAIVKSHYPFSRAYELAESLAKSAKELIKEISNDKKAYAIDWHIARSGLFGSIEEIREREYKVKKGHLNMRPLLLDTDKKNPKWSTWEVFESIIKEFQGYDKNEKQEFNWREKRNKVKAFREALRGGEEKVEQFLTLYELIEEKDDGTKESKLPKVPSSCKVIEITGWHGNTCGYFDAIEMLDLYFPLTNMVKTNEL